MKDEERFFLSSDDDGHYYIVPATRRGDWEDWVADPGGTNWEAPKWATSLGYSYTYVTFTNPRVDLD